jgi:soluble lytic murein transglycosylase-like protein
MIKLSSICVNLSEISNKFDLVGLYKTADKITCVLERIAQNLDTNQFLSPMSPFNTPKMKIPPELQNYANGNYLQNYLLKDINKNNLKYNPQKTPKQIKDYEQHFIKASRQTGFPVSLLISLASAESSFNPTAQSGVGAYGMMQLYPATDQQRQSVESNIMGGAQKLRSYYNELKNIESALAAYNWGITNMKKVGGDYRRSPRSVQSFVQKVLNGAKQYV